jgi:hypothetical protein
MFDPLFDVAPPEAEVFTDPKPQWPFASIAPCIDSGHRHTEIVGEFLDGDKPVVVFHAVMMVGTLSTHSHSPSQYVIACLKTTGLVDMVASGAFDLESAVSGLFREVWEGF